MNWRFPETVQNLTRRDTIIYALGVGVGAHNPFDKKQLRFLYEKWLVALPSMASVLCYPGNWLNNPESGVDYTKVMNAGTRVTIHKETPVEATLTATPRVLEIIDKGPGRGAVIISERRVFETRTGDHVCTVNAQTICRAHGGFGGPRKSIPRATPIPEEKPDDIVDFATPRNSHLVYRLGGDPNALHVDPDAARKAGFDTPVLHGLCTFGIASYAVLDRCCDGDTSRMKAIQVRYTAPVFPGETVRTEIWRKDGKTVQFRASVPARNSVVLDLCEAEIA
jgi:acyl dehydratase